MIRDPDIRAAYEAWSPKARRYSRLLAQVDAEVDDAKRSAEHWHNQLRRERVDFQAEAEKSATQAYQFGLSRAAQDRRRLAQFVSPA